MISSSLVSFMNVVLDTIMVDNTLSSFHRIQQP